MPIAALALIVVGYALAYMGASGLNGNAWGFFHSLIGKGGDSGIDSGINKLMGGSEGGGSGGGGATVPNPSSPGGADGASPQYKNPNTGNDYPDYLTGRGNAAPGGYAAGPAVRA